MEDFGMPTPAPKLFLRTRKATIILLAAVILSFTATATVVVYQRSQPVVQKINYSELYKVAQISTGVALIVEGETLTVRKSDGTAVEATVTGESAQHEVVELFRKNNLPVEFRPVQPGLLVTLVNWLLPILMLAVIGLVGWRVYASMSGRGSFEVADQNGKQNVGFDDVAGVDEARSELTETIEFLKDPARFGRLGGRVPRGSWCAFFGSFGLQLSGEVRRARRRTRTSSFR